MIYSYTCCVNEIFGILHRLIKVLVNVAINFTWEMKGLGQISSRSRLCYVEFICAGACQFVMYISSYQTTMWLNWINIAPCSTFEKPAASGLTRLFHRRNAVKIRKAVAAIPPIPSESIRLASASKMGTIRRSTRSAHVIPDVTRIRVFERHRWTVVHPPIRSLVVRPVPLHRVEKYIIIIIRHLDAYLTSENAEINTLSLQCDLLWSLHWSILAHHRWSGDNLVLQLWRFNRLSSYDPSDSLVRYGDRCVIYARWSSDRGCDVPDVCKMT